MEGLYLLQNSGWRKQGNDSQAKPCSKNPEVEIKQTQQIVKTASSQVFPAQEMRAAAPWLAARGVPQVIFENYLTKSSSKSSFICDVA